MQAFPVGQLVLGRVCALNTAQQQCQLTLKKSIVLPKCAQIKFEALKVGQVLTARVRRVESYGVFLDIEVCVAHYRVFELISMFAVFARPHHFSSFSTAHQFMFLSLLLFPC